MDTAKLKEDLHQIIDQIEDQMTLEAIRTLLSPQVNELFDLQGNLLSQETMEDLLEESEADIEAGRTISQSELKTHIQSWRNNAK